jgi:hypothetical protein
MTAPRRRLAAAAGIVALLLSAAPAVQDDPWPGPHDVGDGVGARALAEARGTWSDSASWEARSDRIRRHLARTLRLDPFPAAGEVGVETTGERALDGYAVSNVRFETMPGLFVHANVYEPAASEGPRPLVLRSHGHFRGTDTDPEGRFQGDVQRLAGLLARGGAVVITWDMMGWGESQQVTHRRPETTALQTFNTMRILDAALEHLDVDPDRVAMTGSSGGGTQTFLATALDPRIDVCAPVVMVSAHFFGGCDCESGLPIHDVPEGAQGPRLRTSNVEFAALAAPRPQLLVSVGGDWTRNTPEVEAPYLRDVYRTLGAPEAVGNAHFADEQHDYGPSKRRAVVGFLAKELGLDRAAMLGPKGALLETPVTVLGRADLVATTPSHPLPERALDGDDAVWRAFVELERPAAGAAAPTGR